MSIVKGSVLVHDGSAIHPVAPSEEGQIVVSNSSVAAGAEYVNVSAVVPSVLRIVRPDIISILDLSYVTVIQFAYIPAEYGNITGVKIASYMNPGATSYDVRVYDQTNDEVLAEDNFTNTTIALHDMGTLSNVPSNDSLINIQINRNGGLLNNAAFLNTVIFNFN